MVDLASMLRSVTEAIGRNGNAKAVFGDPVKLETQTIVPVAVVDTSLGGGGGVGRLFGGGGGGGVRLKVYPLGFIHEQNGAVTFTRIEVPREALLEEEHRHEREEKPQGWARFVKK
jgi:uncharacterized spore protein YtfJ